MDEREREAVSGSFSTAAVVQYYDRLAKDYDRDRFASSYGAYLDAQERRVLRQWLPPLPGSRVLDIACGTGRLLGLATHGIDASKNMLEVARAKHPRKQIWLGSALDLVPVNDCFDAAFCLHLFMHLEREQIAGALSACARKIRIGGRLIFDFPSGTRRRLTGYSSAGWHAGTALTLPEIRFMAAGSWKINACRGILFFPIHRIPSRVRACIRLVDDLLCATPLQVLASYRIVCLERKA